MFFWQVGKETLLTQMLDLRHTEEVEAAGLGPDIQPFRIRPG